MDLKQLRHFLAVVETGSFHKAALRVNVTQQAISRSIKQLEKDCGGRLLERKRGDRRKVSPSPFGVMLIPRAQKALAEIRGFHDELENLMGRGHGQVRLGVAPSAARWLLPEVIRAFRTSHPQVRIQVMRQPTHVIVEQLASRIYEIAICDEPDEEPGPGFVSERLYADRCIFVAGRRHPLLDRGQLGLKDLQHGPWLILGPYCRLWNELRDLYAAEGLTPARHDLETNSVELALRHLVRDGYVSFMPARLVAGELASGEVVHLPVRQPKARTWNGLLLRRSDGSLNVATTAFVETLRRCARDLPPLPRQVRRQRP